MASCVREDGSIVPNAANEGRYSKFLPLVISNRSHLPLRMYELGIVKYHEDTQNNRNSLLSIKNSQNGRYSFKTESLRTKRGDVALDISQLGEDGKLTEQIFTEPRAMNSARAHRTDHSRLAGPRVLTPLSALLDKVFK